MGNVFMRDHQDRWFKNGRTSIKQYVIFVVVVVVVVLFVHLFLTLNP